MSTDTDWDINIYRTKFESEEHWQLKKDFMEAHKDKFSETRLICLAQVYVNIELLRCRYSMQLTQLIENLAEDLGKDYKEKQKNLLQRTFITATHAAALRSSQFKSKKQSKRIRQKLLQKSMSQPFKKSKLKPSQWTPSLGTKWSSDSPKEAEFVNLNKIQLIQTEPIEGEESTWSELVQSKSFKESKFKKAKNQNSKWMQLAHSTDFKLAKKANSKGTKKAKSKKTTLNIPTTSQIVPPRQKKLKKRVKKKKANKL